MARSGMKRIVAAGAVALGSVSFVAAAHHSAIEFDLRQQVPIKGIVKEFEPANPHTKIVVTVTDEKGTRDVEFEGHSRNNYYRGGWREGLVNVGDEITLIVGPRVDGADGGYVHSVVTKDGVTRFGLR